MDDELSNLGHAPLDDLHGERVRRRAQAVLTRERALIGRPWRRRAARGWGATEPLLVAAACVAYLVWAVRFVSALH